jgi:hypothetical protein
VQVARLPAPVHDVSIRYAALRLVAIFGFATMLVYEICLASCRTPNGLRALMHCRISSHVRSSQYCSVTGSLSDETKSWLDANMHRNAMQGSLPNKLRDINSPACAKAPEVPPEVRISVLWHQMRYKGRSSISLDVGRQWQSTLP